MRRLILIRNHMDVLCRLFEGGIAPSLALHYGALHLVQFLDVYKDFMGGLDPRQREQVRCAAGLISDAHKHRDALKKVRNCWVAHPPDDDLLAEDASDFVRRVGLPVDPAAHYKMLVCTVMFIDTARALLPEIAEPTVEKFNSSSGAKPKFHCIDLDQIAQNLSSKLDSVRKEAEQKCPDMQWVSLLGAAGVRLDQLGPSDPDAYTARRDGPREGGGGTAMTLPAPLPRPSIGHDAALADATPPCRPAGLSAPRESRTKAGGARGA